MSGRLEGMGRVILGSRFKVACFDLDGTLGPSPTSVPPSPVTLARPRGLLTDLEVAYRLTCGEAKLGPALPTVAHMDGCTLQADRAPALTMGASQSKKA